MANKQQTISENPKAINNLPENAESLMLPEETTTEELQKIADELTEKVREEKKYNEKLDEENLAFSPEKIAEKERIDEALKSEKEQEKDLTESSKLEGIVATKNLKEKITEIYENNKGIIKKALNLLVLKPLKFAWNHPILTIATVLSMAGLWYFGIPLSFGASALPEESLRVLSSQLGGALGEGAGLNSAAKTVLLKRLMPVPTS